MVCRAPALEPGVEDALVASKLDALAGEYSALLAGQLESQRTWYDGRQAKAIAEAEARWGSRLGFGMESLRRAFESTAVRN